LKIINVIAPYRYDGKWVFDDPGFNLVQEPFISGADTLIDQAVANTLGTDRGFFLIFSGRPFPGYTIRLIWGYSDIDGNWYHSEGRDHQAWLCPALLKYFDDVPRALYVQCKAKPQGAKYPLERIVGKQWRIAEGDSDGQEPALLVGPGGAAAHLGRTQLEHVMPDADAHLHRFGVRALLRSVFVLVLFLIVMATLILPTVGFLSGSRQSRYIFLFFVWIMGSTGVVLLAHLWRAMLLRRLQPREPPT
jgi:hypothetical protein